MYEINTRWPKIFDQDNFDKIQSMNHNTLLAEQLIAYGHLYMGYEPPDNFYEVMDAASKVTGAFTMVECRGVSDRIINERRKNARKFG